MLFLVEKGLDRRGNNVFARVDGMSVAHELFFNISWHGNVDIPFFVIPRQVDADI